MNNDKVVLDLEEQLLNDDEGVLFDNLMTRLGEIKTRLNAESKKMQSKETFKKIEAAEQSIQAALMIMILFKSSRP